MHAPFRRLGLALPVALLFALPAPAAFGATATVTSDGGTPVSLGGPVTIRQMKPDVVFAFAPDEKRYAASVVAPNGAAASTGISCIGVNANGPERVKYLGNGAYTVILKVSKNADDSNCAQATEQRFTFTINAFTSVLPPGAQPLLTRRPTEFGAITYEVPVDANPGADSYDFRYAANAVLSPDGGISDPFSTGFVRTETGKASITFQKPGRYTFVARAKSFRSDVPTAWSPRIDVTVVAPFDLQVTSFPDRRGPTYKLSAQTREPTATGKVKVYIAKGKTGKKFRSLGTAKLRAGGKFSLRFKLKTYGYHRLRYKYAGNATVARGDIVETIKISKTFF
jgi:hypothetical protein